MENQPRSSKQNVLHCKEYFQDSSCGSVKKMDEYTEWACLMYPLISAVCSDPAQQSFGSRDMSIFEEPNSGFVQDWNSFCSICVRLPLLTLLLIPLSLPGSVTFCGLSTSSLPLWDWFPSGRCQPCLTWNHHTSVSGMKGKRLRHLQAMQCFTKSSQDFSCRQCCWEKQLQVQKHSHPLCMKAAGTVTHRGRDLLPSADLRPEVLCFGHQAVKRGLKVYLLM